MASASGHRAMLVRDPNAHGGVRYYNPVPGGTLERTDQGTDVSAPGGTPVYAIATETLVGVIQNWYAGQPFYWFKQKGANIYNYVAEQFKLAPGLKVGSTVQGGQEIGTFAASGTGEELGWATASGETLARATTGYTEGQATPAGQSYRAQVFGNAPPGDKTNAGNANAGSANSLAQLWIDAGGSPALAKTMAAIALAESGGQIGAVNSQSGAAGLWQILPSAHPQYNVSLLTSDALYNAQAAVAVEKSQGLGAWATYTSGAYKQFLSQAASTGASYSLTRPGGQSTQDTGQQVNQVLSDYRSLRDMPRTAPPGTKNPFNWFWSSFTGNWDQMKSDA